VYLFPLSFCVFPLIETDKQSNRGPVRRRLRTSPQARCRIQRNWETQRPPAWYSDHTERPVQCQGRRHNPGVCGQIIGASLGGRSPRADIEEHGRYNHRQDQSSSEYHGSSSNPQCINIQLTCHSGPKLRIHFGVLQRILTTRTSHPEDRPAVKVHCWHYMDP
jgi:hypothetical protein